MDREWLKNIGGSPFELWQESLIQLRQLHGDVWNGVRFFLTLNAILIAALVPIAIQITNNSAFIALAFILSFFGIGCVHTGKKILSGHRGYYVHMLALKTLIEIEFGFWDNSIHDQPLAFPWLVDQQHHPAFLDDIQKWKKEHKWRERTISYWLNDTYTLLYIFHLFCLVAEVIYSYTILT